MRAAAEKLGVSPSSLSILNFCQAKVEAGVESTAPATAKSVKDLRDRQGYRWEMIMAKTDLSKSDVIELYGGEEAAKASYTGRGRNFSTENGVTSTSKSKSASSKSKSASSKSKSAPAGRSTGRTTGKTSTAKSKSAASKSKSASSKGRSTGRRSIAGNPS
jgi:hypothetical protein